MEANMSDYIITKEGELMHYGVLGMKWGIHRAVRKSNANNRLNLKAAKYEKKAANFTKKSEKEHAKNDLGFSNREAVKAAKYRTKASINDKKSIKSKNDFKSDIYAAKAEKYRYKAAKKEFKSNRLSKTTGYGPKALSYSIKSDKLNKKAAKAKMRVANNKRYISMMNRKVNSLSPEELAPIKDWVDRLT